MQHSGHDCLAVVRKVQNLHLQAFPSMERVLEGMHKIAVADISAEASVRKLIREIYITCAVVSTGVNTL